MAAYKTDFRRLVKKLGVQKTARRLGVSEATVRRAERLGPSARLAQEAARALHRSQAATRGWETRREHEYEEEERAAIQGEPYRVPSYGPQKLARVLTDIRRMRGENWVEHQEAKYFIKGLQKRNMPVEKTVLDEIARLERLQDNMRVLEFHMSPADTIEERLHKVENIDREYAQISRQYGLSARAVYSLYYSPPAGAAS